MADAALDDAMRLQRHEFLAIEDDGTFAPNHDAGDGAEQRRFAGAVGAEDREADARGQRDVNRVETARLAIEGGKPRHREKVAVRPQDKPPAPARSAASPRASRRRSFRRDA